MKKTMTTLFLIFSVYSFSQTGALKYSFFVAGHVYGNPNTPSNMHLHPPFSDFIPSINSYDSIQFGFFTGDVVRANTRENWDTTLKDLSALNIPYHIAAGNHDVGFAFQQIFGDYYYDFVHEDDLFIVLTPDKYDWNIKDDQLDFLKASLDSNSSKVNNIFLFVHELIWWSPDNKYKDIKINYVPHYPGPNNFDSIIKPLLLSYDNPITIFAGDLGATQAVSSTMYDTCSNLTLIASGVGSNDEDNVIFTEIYEDTIYYNLVAINGTNPKALGELTKHLVVNISSSNISKKAIEVYPNPSNGILNINTKSHTGLHVNIYSHSGHLIFSEKLNNNEKKLDLSHVKSGTYQIHFSNNSISSYQPLVIY